MKGESMVDPRNEPGFEESSHSEHPEKDRQLNKQLRQHWRDRMNSKLLRMSRGAQNFWKSLPWARKDNWRRKEEKK